jgi:hypothetical protein
MHDIDQTYRILENEVCPGLDEILASYSEGLSPELAKAIERLREATEDVMYALVVEHPVQS